MQIVASNASSASFSGFARPDFDKKFRPVTVRDLMKSVLASKLGGVVYTADRSAALSQQIAAEMRDKIKELNLARYKVCVHVVIGELKGQGARMASRCFWDADVDNVATEVFKNETLFCVANAYGVYHY